MRIRGNPVRACRPPRPAWHGLAAAAALTALLGTPAHKTARPAPAPVFAGAAGHSGGADLSAPAGLTIGPDGRIYVTDQVKGTVEEFTAAGRFLRSFGAGDLSEPAGIAVGPGGAIWVASAGQDKIVEFSAAGQEQAAFGSPGSGPGQLANPQGLAISPVGDVYVADQGNNRVEEFSPAGGYQRSLGVTAPDGLAFAGPDLWVSSSSGLVNDALDEFSPGGAVVRKLGVTQARYGALSNPAAIAIGPGGRLYVTQPDFGWVTVLNPHGGFSTEFGLQSDPARKADNLAFPDGIAIEPDGTVWVADTGNGRIVRFTQARQPAVAASPLVIVTWIVAGLAVVALAGVAWRRRRRPRDPDAGPAGQRAGPDRTGAPERAAPAGAGEASALPPVTRRSLLTGATALTGAGLGAAILPVSVRKALSASMASTRQGSIRDIEHIVILMQENRSFDHYFGTMPGVRGFADPAAIRLPDGRPVFYQPDPSHPDGYLLPFHYDTRTTSAQATPGTDHTWATQHQAWNNGKMDSWIAAKGPYTMGYFSSGDIPFHWALAEAFTICDNYHCSVLGPTDPNRCYLWTATIDPQGKHGGPVTSDAPSYGQQLSWTTYPERLERAGISWQVYQEEDNYGDNALAWFGQYIKAPSSSPLFQRGMAAQPPGTFESDAMHDRLPQVSWLVAPTAQCEHPDYFPAAGAEYIAQKLDAIASHPDVWAKTAFILCYDENDGMFDHVPPPVPAAGTPGEFVGGENIGLGFRTPTTIVSPWTAGGYVASEVFDHTSLIRLIESRFGVREPNISSWRRQTCGDLTSAFRFASPRAARRPNTGELGLAVTESRLLRAQQQVGSNPPPVPPAVNEPLPGQ